MKPPRKPDLSQISGLEEAAARVIHQSDGEEVLMRANARRHRKLKGGRPFGSTIPPIPTPPPFFFWVPPD